MPGFENKASDPTPQWVRDALRKATVCSVMKRASTKTCLHVGSLKRAYNAVSGTSTFKVVSSALKCNSKLSCVLLSSSIFSNK